MRASISVYVSVSVSIHACVSISLRVTPCICLRNCACTIKGNEKLRGLEVEVDSCLLLSDTTNGGGR